MSCCREPKNRPFRYSVALLNQIRAVDRIRLIKRLGTVDDATLERIDEAIKINLGLIRL